MLTLKDNIKAVLDSNFAETKDEIKEVALNVILELIENDRKTEPQTCNDCDQQRCETCVTEIGKDEPQTDKDFKVTYTCSFTDCDNFKNFGFGEKCVECKRKQSEAKYKDEPQTERSE